MAERKKAIDLISAAQVAEREALRLTSAATAERDASTHRGEAIRAQAEADSDADKIRSLAMRIRAEVEADAMRMMNDAHNMLSPDARGVSAAYADCSKKLKPSSAKPSSRWNASMASRFCRSTGSRAGGSGRGHGDGGQGGFADGVVNSALRFRAQAPIVDQLLREIGLESGDIQKLTSGVTSGMNPLAPAVAASPPKSRGKE